MDGSSTIVAFGFYFFALLFIFFSISKDLVIKILSYVRLATSIYFVTRQ